MKAAKHRRKLAKAAIGVEMAWRKRRSLATAQREKRINIGGGSAAAAAKMAGGVISGSKWRRLSKRKAMAKAKGGEIKPAKASKEIWRRKPK